MAGRGRPTGDPVTEDQPPVGVSAKTPAQYPQYDSLQRFIADLDRDETYNARVSFHVPRRGFAHIVKLDNVPYCIVGYPFVEDAEIPQPETSQVPSGETLTADTT